jgi:GH35 family endo-1,4-beta-xylanase
MVENWKRFTDLGLEIAVTELDVRLPVDGQNDGKKDLLVFQ